MDGFTIPLQLTLLYTIVTANGFLALGGYQLKDDWEWPKFKPSEWVSTNIHYGYGCICMDAVVNHKDFKVITIQTLRTKPLKSCKKDPALKKWKSFLQ